MMVDSNASNFEETILSYLKGQEIWPEDNYEVKHDEDAEENVQELMQDLLAKVNKRIACKDRYENLKLSHNQYPLFDMNDYFADFCMDEELMSKLSFRETLLISVLDSTSPDGDAQPSASGGLCLLVETVESRSPIEGEGRGADAAMDREIYQMYQKAKRAYAAAEKLDDYVSETADGMDEELRKTLADYESFLRNEAKANVRKFAVHLSSRFSMGGVGTDVDAGSRITAWVDRDFHTLEEKRTEYFTDNEGQYREKSLYLALQKNKYYLRSTSSPPDLQERKYYGFGKTHDLVGEGANFILMRYLAVTGYKGRLELSTTYINGDMCRNIYECTGPMTGSVNDKTIDVCKIYRTVIEKCGIEHNCATTLTLNGRIVAQEWEGCDFILHVNPLQRLTDRPHDRLALDRTWIDDMELLSKYLDRKTKAELEMKTYTSDHPEMKDILADYLNNILLLKPENILAFTMEFFESLCPPLSMAATEYEKDGDTSTEFYRMRGSSDDR